MTWIKLSSIPGAKIVGKYEVEYWAIIDGKVWHQGRQLRAADAETFEVFEKHEFIARDASCVYHAWSRLTHIDRNSFVKNGEYWQDKNAVYFECESSLKPLQDSDADSFNYLEGSYGVDKKHAWYYGRKIKSCTQSRNLRIIPENKLYANDGENIYFDGKPLPGANPSTWRMINSEFFSCDEKRIYFCEKKLPYADLKSWQHIYKTWSKDQNHVYRMSIIEKNINPECFDQIQAIKMHEQALQLG